LRLDIAHFKPPHTVYSKSRTTVSRRKVRHAHGRRIAAFTTLAFLWVCLFLDMKFIFTPDCFSYFYYWPSSGQCMAPHFIMSRCATSPKFYMRRYRPFPFRICFIAIILHYSREDAYSLMIISFIFIRERAWNYYAQPLQAIPATAAFRFHSPPAASQIRAATSNV
jgi:hypothetical protein